MIVHIHMCSFWIKKNQQACLSTTPEEQQFEEENNIIAQGATRLREAIKI